MRDAFRYLTSLLFAAVVVQVGLAAYGAFDTAAKADDGGSATEKNFDDAFTPHGILGTAIVVIALLLAIVAYIAYRDVASRTAILFVLTVLQMVLAFVGAESPVVGTLHGINALAIYALVAMLAHRVWGERRSVASDG